VGLDGAEAVLKLGVLGCNGDFDTFGIYDTGPVRGE
jgi:hypothetical protein